eukprot:Amastigsp_a351273_6.p4 type:complete len:109 gc:universal Amastigsp_a351273_6:1054-728(-)
MDEAEQTKLAEPTAVASLDVEILHVDMEEPLRDETVAVTAAAFKANTPFAQLGQREMAKQIKTQMEEKFGGAWHVVVGTNFAAFVTHETGNLIYMSIGATLIFVFKHG